MAGMPHHIEHGPERPALRHDTDLSDTIGIAMIDDLPQRLPVTIAEIELLHAAFANRLDDVFATPRKERP